MKKAILLGTRYKHCLHLNDGHYEWNYWDPAGAWDVKPGSPNEWKHWIGAEHTGGYYSLSLMQAVRLYEFGVVFDKTDMERFVKTQVAVCWNGSMDNPQWARVDGTRPAQYMQGEYMCAALAAFNDKVAEFCYGPRGAVGAAQRAGTSLAERAGGARLDRRQVHRIAAHEGRRAGRYRVRAEVPVEAGEPESGTTRSRSPSSRPDTSRRRLRPK